MPLFGKSSSARKPSPGKKRPGSGKKKGRAARNPELAGLYKLFDADGGETGAGQLTKSSEAENAFEFACGGQIWAPMRPVDSTGMKLQGRNPVNPAVRDTFEFMSDSFGNVLGFKTGAYLWKRELEIMVEPPFDGPTATIRGGHFHNTPVEEQPHACAARGYFHVTKGFCIFVTTEWPGFSYCITMAARGRRGRVKTFDVAAFNKDDNSQRRLSVLADHPWTGIWAPLTAAVVSEAWDEYDVAMSVVCQPTDVVGLPPVPANVDPLPNSKLCVPYEGEGLVAQIGREFVAFVEGSDVPGAQLAVVHNDEVKLNIAAGVADLETGSALRVTDRFSINCSGMVRDPHSNGRPTTALLHCLCSVAALVWGVCLLA